MRSLATILAAALLLGTVASANPTLSFDDSGFDYAATDDATTAYVNLERDGDELRFTFSNQPGNDALPTVTIDEVADLEREGAIGPDVLATVADLEEIAVNAHVIRVNHDGAKLADTVESYLAAIQKLGYEAQPAFSSRTLKAFTFGDEDHAYRAIFHLEDGCVQVRLAL